MAKKVNKRRTYSRLNARYLLSRYAGVFFLLMGLGVLCGAAYRALWLPTRYHAQAQVGVSVEPAEAAVNFDWDAELGEWRSHPRDRRDWGLLGINLRHAVKLAVTQDLHLDTEALGAQLATFSPGASFSASLLPGRIATLLGPTILTVTRHDLAQNLDFQSLAVIASDLDPPHSAQGWDFSVFRKDGPHANGVIANPGPDDKYFQVFYQLHRALNNGSEPASPLTAWRSAVDEVAARLDREAEFTGGGGFGHQAKRELLREISAIPALAANCLYHAGTWLVDNANSREMASVWARRWSDQASMDLRPAGSATGTLSVAMFQDLHPLAFPRDTVVTRLPPLVVATLLSYIAARQDEGSPSIIVEAAQETPTPAPTPLPDAAPEVAELEEMPEPPEVTYREVIDDVANQQRLSHIAMVEETVRQTRIERDASLRRLHTARENENRLSYEAVNARSRADRLRERYDETMLIVEDDAATPKVPDETAALFAKRDELLRRLTGLLEYCTEEHPFVREVRREIAGLDVLLAGHTPDAELNRQAEARATRLANLYLEWETAEEQADSLDERARRQADAVSCLLDEVTNIERCVSEREMELSKAQGVPVPILRIEVPVERPPVQPRPTTQPVAKPAPPPPPPAPEPVRERRGPRLVFSPVPTHIDLQWQAPSWWPALWGCLAGCCLGLVWLVLRELFGQTFRNVGEAHRMVKLPVLASLPAYDAKSFKRAAETMRGEIARTKQGRMQFVPAPVEFSEPPPLVKRGKLVPARRTMRWGRWLAGLLCLLLAGLLYQGATSGGFLQPRLIDEAELPLPAATFSVWAEEGESQEWGELP